MGIEWDSRGCNTALQDTRLILQSCVGFSGSKHNCGKNDVKLNFSSVFLVFFDTPFMALQSIHTMMHVRVSIAVTCLLHKQHRPFLEPENT